MTGAPPISLNGRPPSRPGAWRLPATGLAAMLALAACGSAQTRSSAPAPASNPTAPLAASGARSSASRCAAAQLKPAYAGSEGATGHLELTLALRNTSAGRCTLEGYPGARLLDAGGRRLPLLVSHGGGFFPDSRARPRPVVLKAGARALFGVSFVVDNEYAGHRVCRPAMAAMSSAPGATRWWRISLSGPGRPQVKPCGRDLVLSPLRAG